MKLIYSSIPKTENPVVGLGDVVQHKETKMWYAVTGVDFDKQQGKVLLLDRVSKESGVVLDPSVLGMEWVQV